MLSSCNLYWTCDILVVSSVEQKQIPFYRTHLVLCCLQAFDALNNSIFYFVLLPHNRIRDWKTASEMIEYLDSPLSSISVGTLNHVLNFLGKCGKTENMMKV